MEKQPVRALLVGAPGSGSGKTLLSCGLMEGFRLTGKQVAAFKCGPDYIDPQFHRKVLEVPSKNLDSWFAGEELLYRLFREDADQAELSIVEGVMGYYDGLGGTSARASTWEVGQLLGIPALLVVNAAGASVSLGALVKGFLEYRNPSGIRGLVLNQVSPGFYPRLKSVLEKETGVPVYGYLPRLSETPFPGRHLGLVQPDEIPGIRKKLEELGRQCLETLDMEGLWELAGDWEQPGDRAQPGDWEQLKDRGLAENKAREAALPAGGPGTEEEETGGPCICVAKDAAFSFYYQDNLRLLEKLGARICYVSPLADKALPREADALYLGGGYPELYGRELEENQEMRESIREALEKGMPCIAECGGFLYLLEELKDQQGESWKMAGFLPGRSFYTGKLVRFGYVELKPEKEGFCRQTDRIRGHEFHYMDSDNNGEGFLAEKPTGNRNWLCGHQRAGFYAGFPHLYFYSCPQVAEQFVREAKAYGKRKKKSGKYAGSSAGKNPGGDNTPE